jgi:hypothetical protein
VFQGLGANYDLEGSNSVTAAASPAAAPVMWPGLRVDEDNKEGAPHTAAPPVMWPGLRKDEDDKEGTASGSKQVDEADGCRPVSAAAVQRK